MRKVCLTLVACTLVIPLLAGESAIGSARVPSAALAGPSDPTVIPRNAAEALKPKATFFSQVKARFSRFRPAWKQNAIPLDGTEDVLRDKSLLDKIYTQDMNRRMRDKYREVVEPYEDMIESPTRPARHADMARYYDGQRDMVRWAMKEIGQGQLKDFLRRADKGSGAMQVITTVREMNGSTDKEREEERKREDKKLTEAERIARAHRRDYNPKPEEEIPTRLRTRLNVLKGKGALTLQNPIVTAMVEGGAGGGDNLSVELNREFKKLELYSKARYVVDNSVVTFNVQKKITPEISVDLYSERWTGEKRGDSGEKAKDQAKVTYSLAF